MSTSDIWESTVHLAEVWLESLQVQNFRQMLPRNNTGDSAIVDALGWIDGGSSFVSNEPLLPHKWEGIGLQLPFVNMSTPGLLDFLRRSQLIGWTSEIGVAWLRAQLPTYPTIPVPDLIPHTHLTTEEVIFGVGWKQEFLQSGLQFQSYPPPSPLFSNKNRSYKIAMQKLAQALKDAPEWKNFMELTGNLNAEDRKSISDARRELKILLQDSQVNAHEPDRALERRRYRESQVEKVSGLLSSKALEVRQAFIQVDELINLVAVRVLGQLVAYGPPRIINEATNFERIDNTIQFTSNTHFPVSSLIFVCNPLSPDTAIIEGSSLRSEETTELISSVKAISLQKSGLIKGKF